jgi:hypothetical protein
MVRRIAALAAWLWIGDRDKLQTFNQETSRISILHRNNMPAQVAAHRYTSVNLSATPVIPRWTGDSSHRMTTILRSSNIPVLSAALRFFSETPFAVTATTIYSGENRQ